MNSTDYVLDNDPQYQLIPLIWTPPIVTIMSSLLIDHYLTSKPLLSLTVMDFVNRVFFRHLCFYCLVLATASTIGLFFQDSGETVAVVMSCLLYQQFQNFSLMFLGNIATQLLLMNDPMKLDSETFEKEVKIVIGFVVPGCSSLISVVTVTARCRTLTALGPRRSG